MKTHAIQRNRPASSRKSTVRTTLLDVVNAVAAASSTDDEVVAVIAHMFASGRMKLIGQFTERDFATL